MSEIYKTGKAKVIFSRYFPRDYRNLVMERLAVVVKYFPEYWNRTIWVGFEGAFQDTKYGGHFISIDDEKVKIRVVKCPDFWLLAHELMHGVQRIDDNVPAGEKSCDLFTLARDYRLANRSPTYLEIPKEIEVDWLSWVEVAHYVAKDAIDKRQNGTRKYIQWFENKMVDLLSQAEVK